MTSNIKSIEKNNLLKELIVINIGLVDFYNSLKEQKIQVIQVRWSPPAGGDKQMIKLLHDLL